jgi:hypothetical protein
MHKKYVCCSKHKQQIHSIDTLILTLVCCELSGALNDMVAQHMDKRRLRVIQPRLLLFQV